MKVRANQYGQYKGRMQETGSIFEIKDKSEMAYWMVSVDETPKDKAPIVKSEFGKIA